VTTPAYRSLANYYDQLFGFGQPSSERMRRHLLGKILPRIGSACDLACGTGSTALALAGAGLKVYGVDLSPAMCAVARKKALRAHLPVRVIQADMRSFRLPEPVDLVTCEFDAINHVPEKSDLGLVARAVARALRPGGYFYFDVNNRLSFEKTWPLTWFVEKPGVVYVARGGSDPRHDRAWADIELFIRDGRRWRRLRERVEEVCWTPAEVRGFLRQAGFDRVRTWDSKPFFPDDPLIRPGHRTIYLVRKSEPSR
jgi:SAM-dependent methyltransferase